VCERRDSERGVRRGGIEKGQSERGRERKEWWNDGVRKGEKGGKREGEREKRARGKE
jgi:hypothetical protein